jgi:hypothetical protein
VNAPPSKREASGGPLESDEENYLGHSKTKSLAQNWINKY